MRAGNVERIKDVNMSQRSSSNQSGLNTSGIQMQPMMDQLPKSMGPMNIAKNPATKVFQDAN